MTAPEIPEKVLRSIWHHQRFAATQLRASDGSPVVILSPGVPNSDAGPDFLNARIRVGGVTYAGDIELHRDAASWRSHHHDTDPHYNRVILHVVLAADLPSPPARTASRRTIPLLVLHPYLDPLLEPALFGALLEDHSEGLPPLACRHRSNAIPVETITDLLERSARQRLEAKMRRMEERLHQLADELKGRVQEPVTRYYHNPNEIPLPRKEYQPTDFLSKQLWEQLLYEGLMESLGYAKNREAFLTLARSVRLEILRKHRLEETETMMALLFGTAGLLPSSRRLPEKESRAYVRVLRRQWRLLRPGIHLRHLHAGDWLFFRLRPVNFPTARLAALCFLLPTLFGEESFRRIAELFKDARRSASDRRKEIQKLFVFEPDEFWRRHCHFGGTGAERGVAIGSERIDDFIVNVLIPFLLLYARTFKDQTVRASTLDLFERLPQLQENTITRLVQRQLLKDRFKLHTAMLQQGAIQLYKYSCSQGRCEDCGIGS